MKLTPPPIIPLAIDVISFSWLEGYIRHTVDNYPTFHKLCTNQKSVSFYHGSIMPIKFSKEVSTRLFKYVKTIDIKFNRKLL